MIKFTVITVCRNAEKGIAGTVKSVVGQTYRNIEYIICDGESTDHTVKIINDWQRKSGGVIHLFREKDFGVYNAMNRGISRASGDYIIFMNVGDTFYDEDVLTKAAQKIEETGEREAVYYGIAHLINSYRNEKFIEYKKPFCGMIDRVLLGEMPCHQSMIANKKYLREHYFNESYKYRADFEWIVYCCKRKVPMINLNLIICNYDGRGITARGRGRKKLNEETESILKQYYPICYRIFILKKSLHL